MPYRDFSTSKLTEYYNQHLDEFKLNPEYIKSFPTYSEYFSKKHNQSFEYIPIETNIITKRDNTYISMNLDPSLLYQVDYLLASKGKGTSSGFGHSMLRFVFCDPSKVIFDGVVKLSKSCLDHHNYHVVVTYRANISEIQTSLLKGIFGGYQSRLFLIPFNEVKKEYNDLELRSMSAYKLDLSNIIKERIVYRTLENYWTYRNKYYFISNNCATETASLLDSVFWDSQTKISNNETPYGLADELKEKNIIINKPIVFRSYKEDYDKYISIINNHLTLEITLEDFEFLTSQDRYNLYNNIISEDTFLSMSYTKKRQIISSLKLLEKRILDINNHRVMDEFEKLLQEGIFGQNDSDNILSLGTITDNMNIVNNSSMGIPETITSQQVGQLEQNLNIYTQNLNTLYKILYSEARDLAELKESIENNLNYLNTSLTKAKEIL